MGRARKPGVVEPFLRLATLIAGMCAGADYIDDVDLVRAGGMKTLFGPVYAPSTVGTLLREFTFGHARQLDSVLAEHLAGLCEQVSLLPGSDVRAFVDIDSLVRIHGAGPGDSNVSCDPFLSVSKPLVCFIRPVCCRFTPPRK